MLKCWSLAATHCKQTIANSEVGRINGHCHLGEVWAGLRKGLSCCRGKGSSTSIPTAGSDRVWCLTLLHSGQPLKSSFNLQFVCAKKIWNGTMHSGNTIYYAFSLTFTDLLIIFCNEFQACNKTWSRATFSLFISEKGCCSNILCSSPPSLLWWMQTVRFFLWNLWEQTQEMNHRYFPRISKCVYFPETHLINYVKNNSLTC